MIERVSLRPGYDIPRVIKGGWQLAGGHGAVDGDTAVRDMRRFFDAGVTAFDCADIYTGVEEMIGQFIVALRKDRGDEAAGRVQVQTKLVPDLSQLAEFTPRDVDAIVDRSLRRLKIDRLHLLQFFWWDMHLGRPLETLAHLETLQKKGKILHLGVTNWDSDVMATFAGQGLDLAAAQVQYSLLDARPAGRFSDWCRSNRTGILCYGVLAGGFLTNHWLGRPDPGHDFSNRSLTKYRLIIDEFGGWALFQELLHSLDSIAQEKKTDIASLACRYMLDQPGVAAIILGARTARALPLVSGLESVSLDAQDRARIDAVLSRRSGPSGPVYGLEGNRNGRHGRIMKYNLNTPDA